MKTKALFSFVFACISSSSLLATTRVADKITLFLVSEVIKSCPTEFARSLANDESILEIASESSKNQQGLAVTTLIMKTGYAATPMSPSDIVQNTVTTVKTAKAVQPLDGWLEDVNCALTARAK